jgi:hypothetical protein
LEYFEDGQKRSSEQKTLAHQLLVAKHKRSNDLIEESLPTLLEWSPGLKKFDHNVHPVTLVSPPRPIKSLTDRLSGQKGLDTTDHIGIRTTATKRTIVSRDEEIPLSTISRSHPLHPLYLPPKEFLANNAVRSNQDHSNQDHRNFNNEIWPDEVPRVVESFNEFKTLGEISDYYDDVYDRIDVVHRCGESTNIVNCYEDSHLKLFDTKDVDDLLANWPEVIDPKLRKNSSPESVQAPESVQTGKQPEKLTTALPARESLPRTAKAKAMKKATPRKSAPKKKRKSRSNRK